MHTASREVLRLMTGCVVQLREALMCMPALVVLDDLHLLCPAPSQAPEAALSNIGSAALVAWLRDVLREYHARPDGRPALPGVPWPHLRHILGPQSAAAPNKALTPVGHDGLQR